MPNKNRLAASEKRPNRYSAIIGTIFKRHHKTGRTEFEFSRDEFVEIANSLGIALPKNLGDAIYSFRFRTALPAEIVATAPKGMPERECIGSGWVHIFGSCRGRI
jgi:hypothetical protein